ncbi:hypothetical protein H5410_000876, partial [Solanum commersonii]
CGRSWGRAIKMANQIVPVHEHGNMGLPSRKFMASNKLYWQLGHRIKLNNNVIVAASGGVHILDVLRHVKGVFVEVEDLQGGVFILGLVDLFMQLFKRPGEVILIKALELGSDFSGLQLEVLRS